MKNSDLKVTGKILKIGLRRIVFRVCWCPIFFNKIHFRIVFDGECSIKNKKKSLNLYLILFYGKVRIENKREKYSLDLMGTKQGLR